MIATGTPDELKSKVGGQVLEVSPASQDRLDLVTAMLAGRTGTTAAADADAGLVRVPVADAAVLPVIIRDLDEAGVELAEFTLRKASLDEVFLTLTGDRGQASAGVPAEPSGPAALADFAGPADDCDDCRELERTSR